MVPLSNNAMNLVTAVLRICAEDEDLLFVVNVQHHVLWQADVLPKLASGVSVQPHLGLLEGTYVYRLSDLERLHAQMEQLWWDMFYFNGYLRDRTNPGRIAEFQKVFTSPHIQQGIAALK